MLVSFPKEPLPAFWLQVKVTTTVAPDTPSASSTPAFVGVRYTIQARLSLTGYQWSGSFGSHSYYQTHLLFPSDPHTAE